MDRLLDTTKSYTSQNSEHLEEVFRQVSLSITTCYCILTIVQAARMHPMLSKYEGDWATRCIVQARLKATSAIAAHKANKEGLDAVTNVVQAEGRTCSRSRKVRGNCFIDQSHLNLSIAMMAGVVFCTIF